VPADARQADDRRPGQEVDANTHAGRRLSHVRWDDLSHATTPPLALLGIMLTNTKTMWLFPVSISQLKSL
jgi:hypothetical protein